MTTIDNLVHFETPAHSVAPGPDSLGAILVASGKITARDAVRVMELQQREGWRFGEAAVRLRLISERDLVQALNRQYDLPELLPENDGASAELVTAYQQYHPRTEELRALRTQLLIRWFRRPGVERHVLAVVSPGNGEGRSYVAANLAVLFSQLGERTLLIDADLRNPRQHRIFNVPDRVGLGAVLAGRAGTEAAVPIPGLHNLMLLPAGAPPPNPLELLSRPALPALFTEYLADFDVILVDTAPALRYSDAQTVSFRAGSAVVLAHRNHTRVADTNRVVRDFSNSGTRVVGTVINTY
ncbi:MAG: chain length determinant protein tyrosine kinase EpsG [Rhodocyclaceae bacterium]|nr:chain length determinant protein tyrosine kinase EpsG [Rhodocyclaceae bacterium]